VTRAQIIIIHFVFVYDGHCLSTCVVGVVLYVNDLFIVTLSLSTLSITWYIPLYAASSVKCATVTVIT